MENSSSIDGMKLVFVDVIAKIKARLLEQQALMIEDIMMLGKLIQH